MKAEIFPNPEPAPVIDLRRIESTLYAEHFLSETDESLECAMARLMEPGMPPPFAPPCQSRATRFINLRSRGSHRGALRATYKGVDRMVVFESLLELHCLYILMSDTAVVDIWDQPTAIGFVDINGRWTRHTLDYLAYYADGRIIGFAVKPYRKVWDENGHPSDFWHNMRRVRTAAGHPVRIVTERSFSRIQIQDARTTHRYSRQSDPDADIQVKRTIAGLHGALPISTIRDLSGLGGRCFGAVVRAIHSGVLTKAEERRINIDCLVERTRHGR
jgi:hypothetical protein